MGALEARAIFLLSFLSAVSHADSLNCTAAMLALGMTAFYEGRRLDPSVPGEIEAPPSIRGLEHRYLGAGMQGTVFRVLPKEGEPYILKRYHDDSDEEDLFPSDVGVFRALETLPQGGERFRVQRLLEARPATRELVMADARGWQLAAFLYALRNVDGALADGLRRTYNARSRRMMEDLRERGWLISEREPRDDIHSFTASRDGMSVSPGTTNTLIDPVTLEMTLIDPG